MCVVIFNLKQKKQNKTKLKNKKTKMLSTNTAKKRNMATGSDDKAYFKVAFFIEYKSNVACDSPRCLFPKPSLQEIVLISSRISNLSRKMSTYPWELCEQKKNAKKIGMIAFKFSEVVRKERKRRKGNKKREKERKNTINKKNNVKNFKNYKYFFFFN